MKKWEAEWKALYDEIHEENITVGQLRRKLAKQKQLDDCIRDLKAAISNSDSGKSNVLWTTETALHNNGDSTEKAAEKSGEPEGLYPRGTKAKDGDKIRIIGCNTDLRHDFENGDICVCAVEDLFVPISAERISDGHTQYVDSPDYVIIEEACHES